MDTIFVHPPPSTTSKAQEVFDFLIDLDKSANHERSYCFESTAHPRRVLRNAVQLAAHANQRPTQQGALLNQLTSSAPSTPQLAAAVPGTLSDSAAIPVGKPVG
eukprot:CAMPEP_0202843492 /NCGR_PEP_ID=MMETSP1389-20130828/64485_1 /ASSEMBLY_ACC=CAM_ASM_000865 /TAXON_ID=302021 /ORGANISM="Rhodomonas sp., Strain CCMP768" /LENGTH=103 /DNA_ID=CAMNT_0049520641 /DNA_START=1 /DNA_END=312 /DNA_ORIENTATION=+